MKARIYRRYPRLEAFDETCRKTYLDDGKSIRQTATKVSATIGKVQRSLKRCGVTMRQNRAW